LGRYPHNKFSSDTCPYLTAQIADYKQKEDASYTYFSSALQSMYNILSATGVSLTEEVLVTMPSKGSDRMKVFYADDSITYTILAVPPI
jgi:hypothetical protein